MGENRQRGRFTNALTPPHQHQSDSFVDVLHGSNDAQLQDTVRKYVLDVAVGEGMEQKAHFAQRNIGKMTVYTQEVFTAAREGMEGVAGSVVNKAVKEDVEDFTADLIAVAGNEMLGLLQDAARIQRENAKRDIRGEREVLQARVVDAAQKNETKGKCVEPLSFGQRIEAALTGKVTLNGNGQNGR